MRPRASPAPRTSVWPTSGAPSLPTSPMPGRFALCSSPGPVLTPLMPPRSLALGSRPHSAHCMRPPPAGCRCLPPPARPPQTACSAHPLAGPQAKLRGMERIRLRGAAAHPGGRRLAGGERALATARSVAVGPPAGWLLGRRLDGCWRVRLAPAPPHGRQQAQHLTAPTHASLTPTRRSSSATRPASRACSCLAQTTRGR